MRRKNTLKELTIKDNFMFAAVMIDSFGQKKYCYTRKNVFKEVPELELKDGTHSIFLSSRGENEEEVSPKLVKFLKFVKAKPNECMGDFEDEYVKSLQEAMAFIKESREMEGRHMIFQEMLRDEWAEGKAEGKEEGKAESIEEFISKM